MNRIRESDAEMCKSHAFLPFRIPHPVSPIPELKQ